jgi:hypothetical protein
MTVTAMLSARVVGFMTSGATPKSAIAARSPEAPTWPTEEYRTAAAKITAAREAVSVTRAL